MTARIRNITARLRTLALTATLATMDFLADVRDRILDRIPVSFDRTIDKLASVADALERLEFQQNERAKRELAIQNASYAREDAAIAKGNDAQAIRKRIDALLG
jgi:hypothetical protein